jgi:hypothetical protein
MPTSAVNVIRRGRRRKGRSGCTDPQHAYDPITFARIEPEPRSAGPERARSMVCRRSRPKFSEAAAPQARRPGLRPRSGSPTRATDLGYAVTGHSAQGLTVGHGIAVVTGSESRQWLYTAMTRGADCNQAVVFTQPARPAGLSAADGASWL